MTSDVAARLSNALADRYRLERELGTGGMATVHLAHDIKHDRKVAIKVLKPELAAVLGAERFVVEIRTTAALQHPHILPLFDSGTADGFLYYVMPYIEGETIRDKLNRESQFSVEEAVRITREIAGALDYAHRHGVIHRDIKPENLLLHDGRAMVMDFGIALAVSAAAGGRMTETGLSLGTPHYMSPEQATAEKDLTPRADVYSLATVLYEMLTGDPPHVGATAQQVIMKIITEAAQPVTAHRRTVPPHVAAALARALEKLPADRFESAKAFGEALGSEGFTYSGSTTLAATAVNAAGGAAGGRRRRSLATLAGWGVAAAALAIAAAGWMREVPEPPFRRLDIAFGEFVPLVGFDVTISPDGSMLAAAGSVGGDAGIYIRQLGGDAAWRKVPGTDRGNYPEFSPDNEWIVFRRLSERTLVKVNVNGGGAVTLVNPGAVDAARPHWGEDGRIVFSSGGGASVWIVPAAGGDVQPLPKVVGRRPFLLPDGSGVLFTSNTTVSVYRFDGDTVLSLVAGRFPTYVETGHLLYSPPEGGLFAIGFDLASHRVVGSPVRVLERVGSSVDARGYAVSKGGDLVQFDAEGLAGGGLANNLVVVNLRGGVDTLRVPPGRYSVPSFSKDGGRVVVEQNADSRGAATDIHTFDLATGTFTQLTFDQDNDRPVWSPDGKLVAFDRTQGGPEGEQLFVKPADNSGPERRVGALPPGEKHVAQWIDERTLLYSADGVGRGYDIFTIPTDSGAKPTVYLQTPFSEMNARLSPDRSLMAFDSDETGAFRVWLRDYPTPTGKWRVSSAAGGQPRWSPDGKSILWWQGGQPMDTLFRARVDRTPGIVVRAPEFVIAFDVDGIGNWDLHPDGQRFVAATPMTALTAAAGGPPPRYLLLQNWFSELRRLTTSTGR